MKIVNYNKISVQGFTLTSWRANWTDKATEANQDNTIDADFTWRRALHNVYYYLLALSAYHNSQFLSKAPVVGIAIVTSSCKDFLLIMFILRRDITPYL